MPAQPLKRTLLLIAVLIALPYARTAVYDFPPPAAFSGAEFLNPYANGSGHWLRANFHAHGQAWSGITNGEQPNHEVIAAYRKLGYDIAGLSNYQRIAAKEGADTLPIYEHGYSLGKRHQLAIGARSVEWMDYPLFQSLNHKQQIIDLVKQKSDLVAIAHPTGRDAYTLDDFKHLTGYQLMEVVNGPFDVEETWDAALSAGRLVWGLGNDDNHDLADLRRLGTAWTMVDARSTSVADVIASLRAGRHYSVLRKLAADDPNAEATELVAVEFADGRLSVRCTGALATFVFVGQNGSVRKTVTSATNAEYRFTDQDPYIRVVVDSPRTVMYLNPIVRWDGMQVPSVTASVNPAGTWLLRGGMAGGLALAFFAARRRFVTATSPDSESAIPAGDRKPA